jgi:hypothetical protein
MFPSGVGLLSEIVSVSARWLSSVPESNCSPEDDVQGGVDSPYRPKRDQPGSRALGSIYLAASYGPDNEAKRLSADLSGSIWALQNIVPAVFAGHNKGHHSAGPDLAYLLAIQYIENHMVAVKCCLALLIQSRTHETGEIVIRVEYGIAEAVEGICAWFFCIHNMNGRQRCHEKAAQCIRLQIAKMLAQRNLV